MGTQFSFLINPGNLPELLEQRLALMEENRDQEQRFHKKAVFELCEMKVDDWWQAFIEWAIEPVRQAIYVQGKHYPFLKGQSELEQAGKVREYKDEIRLWKDSTDRYNKDIKEWCQETKRALMSAIEDRSARPLFRVLGCLHINTQGWSVEDINRQLPRMRQLSSAARYALLYDLLIDPPAFLKKTIRTTQMETKSTLAERVAAKLHFQFFCERLGFWAHPGNHDQKNKELAVILPDDAECEYPLSFLCAWLNGESWADGTKWDSFGNLKAWPESKALINAHQLAIETDITDPKEPGFNIVTLENGETLEDWIIGSMPWYGEIAPREGPTWEAYIGRVEQATILTREDVKQRWEEKDRAYRAWLERLRTFAQESGWDGIVDKVDGLTRHAKKLTVSDPPWLAFETCFCEIPRENRWEAICAACFPYEFPWGDGELARIEFVQERRAALDKSGTVANLFAPSEERDEAFKAAFQAKSIIIDGFQDNSTASLRQTVWANDSFQMEEAYGWCLWEWLVREVDFGPWPENPNQPLQQNQKNIPANLTEQQRRIVEFLMKFPNQSLNYAEKDGTQGISETLHLEEKTVRNYVATIKRQWGDGCPIKSGNSSAGYFPEN